MELTTISKEITPVSWEIPELQKMKKYPKSLYFLGDRALLKKQKISIVGTRKPNQYTRNLTMQLAQALSKRDICIVSGAAMGVDALAHKGANSYNTIAVMANGLDIRYPAVNKSLIESIENEGLVISQFNKGVRARSWSFVVRNELVVALGDVLIVTQADLGSGTMRSVEYALKMDKKIYVLPHRIGESEATQELLCEGKAEAIYNIDRFCNQFAEIPTINEDPILLYCKENPSYDSAIERFGDKILEYELEGKLAILNGKVSLN
ncbi:MAG: DNA-processing protein DprA [Campylobacterota bacterium]|nr:DNA-processing protein DprA [Campylobacterota bacterium]